MTTLSDWAIGQTIRRAEAAALRAGHPSPVSLPARPTAPPAARAASAPVAQADRPVPRELSAQERAERAADLAPSADGPDVDLGALATMIARAEKCSPADGLRRAHQRYERLSIAARTGRDPGSRSSRGEPAPARSTKAVVGATQDPADVMGAAKMIQNRDGCDFAKAMSKAHREFPGLSEQARTQGVPFVGR